MIDHGGECVFRILGPVQVQAADGSVTFARRQQRDLLALLLLRADQVMPVDHIVDAMWGADVPRTASLQIKNMVSGLRSALTEGTSRLATVDWQPAGYRIRIRHGQLDLAVFTGLVARSRTAPAAEAIPLLRQAVGLWRGRQALAGVRAVFADDARTHLEERRTDALEALFAAELDTANHAAVIAPLAEAVTEHPTRERLVAQLMTALHRSGRTSDALGAYQRARRVLIDDYALEPGPQLRHLERQILQGDPAVDAPAARAAVALPRRSSLPVPAQLPPDVRGFAGRAAELALLDALVDDADQAGAVVISVLMGSAGVGKTSLAIHWAHRAAHRFPDGQLYVNLAGFEADAVPMAPGEAVRGFLEALAVPPERIPTGLHAQAALYRSLAAGRRMLVLLDNAVSAEQVRPLLPGATGCLVLVTSRNRLTSLVVAEGAHPVTLDLLTDAEARDLLVARLGAARVRADERAVERIADRCARLPLALAVVAARAAIHPAIPLGTLAAQLAEANALGALAGQDPGADVRAVFSWSYQRLGHDAAGVFRRLGLHPGPEIAISAAASLVGMPVESVDPLLTELTNAHLIAEAGPGRFVLHDLLRAYAAELSATADPALGRRAAVRRLLDHYLHTADRAARRLYPHRYQIRLLATDPDVTVDTVGDRDQALAWFGGAHRVLVAAVELAAAEDLGDHAWQLAATIGTFADRRGHWDDWISALRTALATAERLGGTIGQAHAHSGLGLARSRLRRYAEAHDHLDRALTLFAELDDGLGAAYTHLRMSAVCEGMGRPGDALAHSRQARRLYGVVGHREGVAQALNNIGWYLAQLGSDRAAISHCEQALALHRELGDRQGTAHTLDSLGYVHHRLGDFDRAAAYYRESATMLRESGDRSHEAFALTHLGDAHGAAGHREQALDAWAAAQRIFDELRHPEADQVAAKIRELRRRGPRPAPSG
ncbi:DNA-binding SARP family transcriptional activator [Allocatelliglobosispora scoriae]|uniref:DNA-binding SARP family transcriptional activator n=1 Tax=Allocatelliglobosispora scoriae TaxID=643052 RepID=A0A841C4K0_9ACTN|nr:BTAD domain-containing putative transcriptional regulator [Allocatelliglobosispora scoriae]MBB5874229.1 DNA-binding SARP family transcriptional activator [Allocatelliglobosispora scoriae]